MNTTVSKIEQTEIEIDSSIMSVVKPFMKWVGGKTQILDNVLSLVPKEMKNYHEPFLGGGSVLLGILSLQKNGKIKITDKVYASDLNRNLIALYQNIQSNVEEFIKEVKTLCSQYQNCKGLVVNRNPLNETEAFSSGESYYYWIRNRFNALTAQERCSVKGSAMLLFLNKTGFRGMYREGPKGLNIPYGNYKNPTILEESHIREVSVLIQGVIFKSQSFTDSLRIVKPSDFVYLDPPYAPETTTSFVGYTSDGFDMDSHKLLFKTCQELQEKGVKFLMSNADVPFVKEAFPSPVYTTDIIVCRRAINSKKPESKTNEVLIRN